MRTSTPLLVSAYALQAYARLTQAAPADILMDHCKAYLIENRSCFVPQDVLKGLKSEPLDRKTKDMWDAYRDDIMLMRLKNDDWSELYPSASVFGFKSADHSVQYFAIVNNISKEWHDSHITPLVFRYDKDDVELYCIYTDMIQSYYEKKIAYPSSVPMSRSEAVAWRRHFEPLGVYSSAEPGFLRAEAAQKQYEEAKKTRAKEDSSATPKSNSGVNKYTRWKQWLDRKIKNI